jgi:hypothetical protein
MHFIISRKKFSLPFSIFVFVLLSIVSITFGTVISSANSTAGDNQAEAGRFGFLTQNPSLWFSGKDAGQKSSSSQVISPEDAARQIADSSVFDEFDNWVDSYVKSADRNTFKADEEQIGKGERLAIKRKEMLRELMQVDPKAALARAIPQNVYNQLPSFITENSEKQISAEGDFLVYAIDGNKHSEDERDADANNLSANKSVKMHSSRIERAVVIGDNRYKAIVYGRRESMTTKMDIPLHGIVLDDTMVVNEAPARVIGSGEFAEEATTTNAPVMDESQVAAEIGGKVVRFGSETELDAYVSRQIEWESKIGPTRVKQSMAKGRSAKETLAPESTSAWTQGPKTVLFIRVDFSDKTGEPLSRGGQPLTQADAKALIDSQVNTFYANNSYNKTSLTATVTPLLRMPRTRSYYTQGENYNDLLTDARNAAAAEPGNYNPANFDFDIVGLSYSRDASWLGIGLIGGPGTLLNGAFLASEVSHELGHNYGLFHANLYRTSDGSVIGPGYHIEYGDCFDDMGAVCTAGQYSHFNARYKQSLNWLTAAEVLTVTGNNPSSNNIYRIYAQDLTSAGGIRALKIPKDDNRNYWVEFRQLVTNNQNAMNGAIIRWEDLTGQFPGTEVLDMTPSTTTLGDEPLLIGQNFIDNHSGIKITVLGKGNTPTESLDIRVDFTIDCSYSLSPTTAEFSSGSGTGSTNVIVTGNNCSSWSAVPATNSSWINITGGNSGIGNGTVSYSVQFNTGLARTGTINIAGQTFTVNQLSGNCDFSNVIAPKTTFDIPATGGTLNYTQTNFPLCNKLYPINIATPSWIDLNTDPIRVLPNNGPARDAEVTLTAQNTDGSPAYVLLTVRQAGQTATCSFPLNMTSQNFAATGGTGVFSIKPSNTTTCSSTYSVTTNASWITISNPAGSTSDNINYTVAPNTSSARTGTITINNPVTGNQTLTITQEAGKSRKRIRFI